MLDIEKLRLTDGEANEASRVHEGKHWHDGCEGCDRAMREAQLRKALWGFADWVEKQGTWAYTGLSPVGYLQAVLEAAGIPRFEGVEANAQG